MTMIAAMTIAAPMRWAAETSSVLRLWATTEPRMTRAYSTLTTVSPALPSHGVERREPARVSMTAIGTLMLNTVCTPTMNIVHGPARPSAGI